MANVLFKRGLQSNLDALRTSKTATDGTFYMTSDSHRLYVGISSGDAVPVNEGITIVNNLGQLPDVTTYEQKRQHTGQFYYIDNPDPTKKEQNILCVFNGQKWVQINPNTNTEITGVEYSVSVADNKASVTYTITQTGGTTHPDTFTLKGDNGIEVSGSGKDIVITGDTYELGVGYNSDTKEATVSLTSENTDNDTSFKIKSKDGNLSMRKSANDTLELTVKDTALDTVTTGNGTSEDDTSTEKEGLYVTVKDSDGNEGTAHINPSFQVGGEQAYYESVKIVNGTVALPVYSKTEIDTKMKTLDAMTYKGTLGTGGSVSSLTPIVSQLELGDTFLIAAPTYEFTYTYSNGSKKTWTGKKGDMFIINGTEIPATGKIDPDTISIDLVPSGDDAPQDTTYTVVPNAKGFTIKGSTGTDAGIVEFIGDDNISISSAADASDPTKAKVTIAHKHLDGTAKTADTTKGDTIASNYNSNNDLVNQSQDNTLQIQVVESIIRDAAGHIKGVNVKKYNLKDTNGHLDSDASKVVGSTNDAKTIATIAHTIGFTSAGGSTTYANTSFGVSSSSLQVSTTNTSNGKSTNVTVDMVWGSFDPS